MYYLIPWPDSQYYDDYDESDGVFSSVDEDGTPIVFVDEDLQRKIKHSIPLLTRYLCLEHL